MSITLLPAFPSLLVPGTESLIQSHAKKACWLDFDDTIFCTSKFMQEVNLTQTQNEGEYIDYSDKLSDTLKRDISELSRHISEMFYILYNKGYKIVIVTNAAHGWVQFCLKTYMPLIFSKIYIYNIQIISARFTCPIKELNNPILWKYATFMSLKSQMLSGIFPNDFLYDNFFDDELQSDLEIINPEQCEGIYIIAIGDSIAELEAIRKFYQATACYSAIPIHVEFVKLIENPSLDVLIKQAKLIMKFITDDKSIHTEPYRELIMKAEL